MRYQHQQSSGATICFNSASDNRHLQLCSIFEWQVLDMGRHISTERTRVFKTEFRLRSFLQSDHLPLRLPRLRGRRSCIRGSFRVWGKCHKRFHTSAALSFSLFLPSAYGYHIPDVVRLCFVEFFRSDSFSQAALPSGFQHVVAESGGANIQLILELCHRILRCQLNSSSSAWRKRRARSVSPRDAL